MRKAAWVCFAIMAVVLGVWLAQGRELVTLTERMVKERVVDEFGDTETKVRWQPTFRIGLMDAAGPAAGGAAAAGALLWWWARRRERRRARAAPPG